MGPKTSIFLLLLLSLALGVLRSDRAPLPGAAGGAQTQELSFWNGFTGPDGRVMLELVREFNQSNDNVHVSMQRIAWATYYNKLMVSAVDGRGPEVFILQSGLLPRMMRADFLDVVNDVYGSSEELKAEFDPNLLELLNFGDEGGDRFLGLPLDVWPHGLYCNAEMLQRAGLVNADGTARPPTNRQEFLHAASVMKIDADGDGVPEQWGWGFGAWHYNFMSLVPQFGGQYLDENGEPTLDHPGNVAALQFLADMLKHRLAPSPEGSVAGWVGFRQRRVAMVWDGVYMLGDLKRLEGHPYLGAPLPQVGPYPGTFADSHVLCIRKGLDAEKREAAARFVRFISDRSLEWAAAGQVPARRSIRQSAEFEKLQVPYAFSLQLPYVMYPPKTPSINEFQLHVNLAVEKAIRGRATPAEALRQANEDFKRYLEVDRQERNRLARGEAR